MVVAERATTDEERVERTTSRPREMGKDGARVKSGYPLHRQRLFPHPKTIRRIRIDIPINRRLSSTHPIGRWKIA